MKYKPSKRKIEPLEEGEVYYIVRYKYNGMKYRTEIGAKSTKEARKKFIPLHGEECIIHDCRKK